MKVRLRCLLASPISPQMPAVLVCDLFTDALGLRQRYDNGDDPNDPTGGQGGGNPFAHHGGGFQQFFQQGGFPGGFPGGGQKFHFQQQWG